MPRDTGAISLLMLAAALLVGILGISEREQTNPTTRALRPADWLKAESKPPPPRPIAGGVNHPALLVAKCGSTAVLYRLTPHTPESAAT